MYMSIAMVKWDMWGENGNILNFTLLGIDLSIIQQETVCKKHIYVIF